MLAKQADVSMTGCVNTPLWVLDDGANLPRHCRACGCYLLFSNEIILGRGRSKEEVLEAYFISLHGEDCISTTSVHLLEKEFALSDQSW